MDLLAVKSVLTNEIAIGQFVFNKRSGHFPNKPRMAPSEHWMRIRLFAPIVAPTRFRAAAAKLKDRAGRRFSDEELLNRLRRLSHSGGTLSSAIIDNSPLTPSSRAYVMRFGSLETAYRLIGYCAPKMRGRRLKRGAYEKAVVQEGLKRLLSERGFLTMAMINADSRLPTAKFVRKLFGGLNEAFACVGFDQTPQQRQRAGIERALRRSKAVVAAATVAANLEGDADCAGQTSL